MLWSVHVMTSRLRSRLGRWHDDRGGPPKYLACQDWRDAYPSCMDVLQQLRTGQGRTTLCHASMHGPVPCTDGCPSRHSVGSCLVCLLCLRKLTQVQLSSGHCRLLTCMHARDVQPVQHATEGGSATIAPHVTHLTLLPVQSLLIVCCASSPHNIQSHCPRFLNPSPLHTRMHTHRGAPHLTAASQCCPPEPS